MASNNVCEPADGTSSTTTIQGTLVFSLTIFRWLASNPVRVLLNALMRVLANGCWPIKPSVSCIPPIKYIVRILRKMAPWKLKCKQRFNLYVWLPLPRFYCWSKSKQKALVCFIVLHPTGLLSSFVMAATTVEDWPLQLAFLTVGLWEHKIEKSKLVKLQVNWHFLRWETSSQTRFKLSKQLSSRYVDRMLSV